MIKLFLCQLFARWILVSRFLSVGFLSAGFLFIGFLITGFLFIHPPVENAF
jgi:hypothetical protein